LDGSGGSNALRYHSFHTRPDTQFQGKAHSRKQIGLYRDFTLMWLVERMTFTGKSRVFNIPVCFRTNYGAFLVGGADGDGARRGLVMHVE